MHVKPATPAIDRRQRRGVFESASIENISHCERGDACVRREESLRGPFARGHDVEGLGLGLGCPFREGIERGAAGHDERNMTLQRARDTHLTRCRLRTGVATDVEDDVDRLSGVERALAVAQCGTRKCRRQGFRTTSDDVTGLLELFDRSVGRAPLRLHNQNVHRCDHADSVCAPVSGQ